MKYTYLIGWSELDMWYYGRRTAKGCHPSEFWVSYFTSSKYVKKFVKEYGEPDVIEIRKTFDEVNQCKNHESRVLKRLKVETNDKWLNKKEGDKQWDTTGTTFVKNSIGEVFQVSVDDPRYLSGELIHVAKGIKQKSKHKNTVVVRDTNGLHFRISKDDPRYLSGEFDVVSKGYVPVKDSDGNTFRVSKDDPRYLSGELIHASKNVSNIKCKGMITVRGNDGVCFNVSKDDPRYLSGELLSASKGVPKSKTTKRGTDEKITCPHCGKLGGERAMKRWHFDNCTRSIIPHK